MANLMGYILPWTMISILTAGGLYALSGYEPASEKRKRIFREKELARKALREQSESTQTPNKQ